VKCEGDFGKSTTLSLDLTWPLRLSVLLQEEAARHSKVVIVMNICSLIVVSDIVLCATG
jgi:hypothetical protein